jgi:hypothetical protein
MKKTWQAHVSRIRGPTNVGVLWSVHAEIIVVRVPIGDMRRITLSMGARQDHAATFIGTDAFARDWAGDLIILLAVG